MQQVDAKKLFVRTVKLEFCGDDAVGGMVQWGEEDGKENRGCRDNAVGGRVQCIVDEKLFVGFVGTVRPEKKKCGGDAIVDMVQQEENEEEMGE